jgi:hypothetical protein
MASFAFNNQLTPQSEIDIEKIGNCCLCGYSEKTGFSYYLLTQSDLGSVEIFTYGPIVEDIDEIPDNYNCAYQKTAFEGKKIATFINKWLNDRSKQITDATEVDKEQFIANLKDMRVLIKGDQNGNGVN